MEKPFHPNDIDNPNYKQMLQEHYKRVNKRLGVSATPQQGISRLEHDLANIVDTKPIVPITFEDAAISEVTIRDEGIMEAIKRGEISTVDENNVPLKLENVFKKVCEAYDAPYHDVVGPSRTNNVVRMRANIIQTLFVIYGPKLTMARIGELLNRDHTTIFNMKVVYSINTEETCKNYSNIKYSDQDSAYIKNKIKQKMKQKERIKANA